MSEESITRPSTTDNCFDPEVIYNFGYRNVKFKAICIKQDSAAFTHQNIIISYISYKLDTSSRNLNMDFILGNCLFGALKLIKNANLD